MSSYPIPCYADMQRAVSADSGAGTSSYWVMPSNTAIWNFSIFWNRTKAELIYWPISVATFPMMFHRLVWTNFVYYILAIRLNLSLSVNLTSHFSNFADFRQLPIPNAQTKCHEILLVHTKTHHYTAHKIANWYFEFEYHFSTLLKNSNYFWTRVYNRSNIWKKGRFCNNLLILLICFFSPLWFRRC